MAISPVSSITRSATKVDGEPLNILTFPTHERYETGLAKTGHNFYAYRAEGIKNWNTNYGEIPKNYHLLNPDLNEKQIPLFLDFDLVMSQNKFGQFQFAKTISEVLHLPLLSLEHTLPMPEWDLQIRQDLKQMRGDINVFISEYSIGQWDWEQKEDTFVVHHGVNTDLFKPKDLSRENRILSVVNDWINRDWCCGFYSWQRITDNLPVRVVGDTPGLSEPAPTIEKLVEEYYTSRIFLNTSTISPGPTSLLEAMSCGCAVVSTATCMIPEIIENGVNGFISNDEKELRENLVMLLNDPDLASEIGNRARETVLNDFSESKFIETWQNLLSKTSEHFFKG